MRVIPTTKITTINEVNRAVSNPPPFHALIKLSKYIPLGIVKPDILLPGSLNARNKIEKKGYNTKIEPIIKIVWANIFSLFL